MRSQLLRKYWFEHTLALLEYDKQLFHFIYAQVARWRGNAKYILKLRDLRKCQR